MHNPSSLDVLRTELRCRGLPPAYVQRVIDELRDHKADVIAEHRAKGQSSEAALTAAVARLGDTSELVDAAVSQYQGSTFCGRHPMITFVLTPIPAVVAVWIVTFLLGWSGLYVLDKLGITLTATDSPGSLMWLMVGMRAFDWLLVFGAPALVAYWLCRRAFGTARRWPWMVVACALVGLIAVAFQTHLIPPTAGPGSGRYTIGLGIGTLMQGTHALLPTLVGACFILRRYLWCRGDAGWIDEDGANLEQAA